MGGGIYYIHKLNLWRYITMFPQTRIKYTKCTTSTDGSICSFIIKTISAQRYILNKWIKSSKHVNINSFKMFHLHFAGSGLVCYNWCFRVIIWPNTTQTAFTMSCICFWECANSSQSFKYRNSMRWVCRASVLAQPFVLSYYNIYRALQGNLQNLFERLLQKYIVNSVGTRISICFT